VRVGWRGRIVSWNSCFVWTMGVFSAIFRPYFTREYVSRGSYIAQMAELVDALGSGPSGGNTVEVRVLFRAPCIKQHLAVAGSISMQQHTKGRESDLFCFSNVAAGVF
jgi:hypothetical protein